MKRRMLERDHCDSKLVVASVSSRMKEVFEALKPDIFRTTARGIVPGATIISTILLDLLNSYCIETIKIFETWTYAAIAVIVLFTLVGSKLSEWVGSELESAIFDKLYAKETEAETKANTTGKDRFKSWPWWNSCIIKLIRNIWSFFITYVPAFVFIGSCRLIKGCETEKEPWQVWYKYLMRRCDESTMTIGDRYIASTVDTLRFKLAVAASLFIASSLLVASHLCRCDFANLAYLAKAVAVVLSFAWVVTYSAARTMTELRMVQVHLVKSQTACPFCDRKFAQSNVKSDIIGCLHCRHYT